MRKLIFLVVLVCTQFGHAQLSPPIPIGLDSLTQLDRLPLLRQDVWFHSVSSQDVTGGNNDGFTAAYSYQYIENGRYVLLDTRGPACVQLFRTARINQFTNVTGFDGNLTIETRRDGKPNAELLPFGDLYSGRRAPFLAPLVREEKEAHGSAWSFVPICSEDGIKISTDKGGPLLFYDIFYHTYSAGTAVKAFTLDMDASAAVERWKALGQPLDPRPSQVATRRVDLPARTIVPVYDASEAGTITAIHLKLGTMTHEALRHVRIKAYWDGQTAPAVDSPLGPFFGTGYWPVPDPPGTLPRYGLVPTMLQKGKVELGRIATRSLPVGAGEDGFYNFFPMPFYKSARVELVNESDTPLSGVEVTVNTVAGPPPASSAYFHAQWREENPTLPYHDYTVLETRGHGHYVGAVLVMSSVNYNPAKRGEVQRWYLEGDARFYIDANRTFVNASTGTEEYFMWGWYDLVVMDKVFSFPANGYPVHDIDSQDNTVMYRFHLSDLVPYYRSFRFALEHGPEGNLPANYSSTAFYYQVDTPSLEMTDQLTLGDSQSEQAHAYSPGKVVWQGCRDLPFEGDRQIVFTNAYKADAKNGTRESLGESLHACGQRVAGAVEFSASILPDNQGVKLRRTLDYAPPDMPGQEADRRAKPLIAPGETAHVFVDGERVAEWYTPPRHARLAWLEEDLEIPASFTAGKQQVKIRLEVAPGTSWSAFQYRVYSYREKK
jgi:hypothetical protein